MTDPRITLSVRWSKREKDLLFHYPSAPDGHLLNHALCGKRQRIDLTSGDIVWDPSLADELEKRGYDLTTLRFAIQKKAT